MDNNHRAIRSTLVYRSIFDYPLTREELWHYAISQNLLEKTTFFTALKQDTVIDSRNGYYFLKGMDKLVDLRLQRQSYAQRKMLIAKKVASFLRLIPFIIFIGVTGSLATGNTKPDDDIDLFIITKNNTVWLTRILVFLVLQVLRKRRTKHTAHVSDMICSNLFMEVSHITLPADSRNIYIAHEIAQIKPLFDHNNFFRVFLAANRWITTYLPNVEVSSNLESGTNLMKFQGKSHRFVTVCNNLARRLQLWYMTEPTSSAIISDTVLAFYTSTTEKLVLKKYQEGVRKYTTPL